LRTPAALAQLKDIDRSNLYTFFPSGTQYAHTSSRIFSFWEAQMIAQYFTQPDLEVGIILVLLGSGLLCLLAGIIILIGRSFSGEMRTLAATSTELSKRAISHDMTALANTTSDLLSTINDLMKTAAGTGAFLILVGVVMMAAAYWLTNGLI
jgi:hypothetical protein